MFTSRETNKPPSRWFTILFLILLVMSFPVILLLAILLWLLYYFLSGRESKFNLRRMLEVSEQVLEPPILLVACLMVAMSLFVTTEVGSLTYAGFPFHFVTFYNYLVTDPPVDFWARFAPNWNVDGRLFLNVFLYYILILIVRLAFTRVVDK